MKRLILLSLLFVPLLGLSQNNKFSLSIKAAPEMNILSIDTPDTPYELNGVTSKLGYGAAFRFNFLGDSFA